MKRSYLFVALVVLLVVAGFYYWRQGRSVAPVFHMVDQFAAAEKRSAAGDVAQAIRLIDPTIDGQQRQAIFMHPTSRLTFKAVRIPDDAVLRTAVALLPDAWTKEGSDGVLFRFGVSDGRTYDELLKQHVDPANNRNDRRWIPVEIDLSAYAGQQVDLVFNTNASLPGRPENTSYDWAVWAAPEIYVHR